jgi:DNA-binding winged helix-turn-helix (wHTH) protein
MEFAGFRLDTFNLCLWRRGNVGEDERTALTPKAFDVLRYLVEHAGRLVAQDEILSALRPQSYVNPEVLKHHVQEVRKALGDDPRNPWFIETMPRRGSSQANRPVRISPPAWRIGFTVTREAIHCSWSPCSTT